MNVIIERKGNVNTDLYFKPMNCECVHAERYNKYWKQQQRSELFMYKERNSE